ncbi:MAG: twitching motility protein PilT [Bacteroidetes bacterium 24-39-8]|nr:PIN domain-containing protein [Gammaproteobacteria bacterium]OYY23756.1 MAG: twitching motility protein PilT [Thiotrichales bacterium 35-46-9]OYZ52593.1 MAG: twitching motility protein PilT [Bacteroidetes bacterium 24-39-8]HQR96216.1 PIN domain-containing protein [Thiotrichales bacterium]
MRDKAFVDTNIWLYALFTNATEDLRNTQAKHFLSGLVRPCLSTQVIRETCSNLIKKANTPENTIQALLTSWYRDCEVIESSLAQSLLASRLRQDYRFSYWDSHVVAAALDAGCTKLYSEDMQHGLLVENILVIQNPFKF